MTPKRYDVIVLGGGMAGLNTAVALGKRGRRVLVLDRRHLPGTSSPAAAGILDPFLEIMPGHPLFRMTTEAFRRYPAWVRALEKRTGIRTGYARIGMLYAAFTETELQTLRSRYAWQKKTGISALWKTREQILKSEPEVSPKVKGGLFYPAIARIHPRRILEALRQDARRAGVEIQEAAGNFTLHVKKGRVAGVASHSALIEAPVVVNALGSWAGKNKSFGPRPPVFPVRGQIQVVQGPLRIRSVLHTLDGGYIVPWSLSLSGPRRKREFLLGSTVEKGRAKAETTSVGLKAIRRKCDRLAPSLKALREIDRWAGLRPGSGAGRPMIGPSRMPGLFWAVGYYRSGILIGPYAGELLARGIVSGQMPAELKDFLPENR